MKTKYQAVLFHPEGDYVTDFHRNSKEEVKEEIVNMGSKWIFYPLTFVATNKTIIDAPEGLKYLERKRIKTVKKFLNDEWQHRKDEICKMMNENYPLFLIY